MHKNKTFVSSFKNAYQGISTIWKEERNIKIETDIGLAAVALCMLFQVEVWEWIAVLLCCMIVLSLECFNSALEKAVDFAGEEVHELAGKAKDFAAGAVLVAAGFAAVIGILIFLPRFWNLITG